MPLAPESRFWVSGYPELLAQWHPTKNGTLSPDRVSYGSSRRVWWTCPNGPDHEWRASPNARTSNGTGCPFCGNIAVSVTNSLGTIAPDLVGEWDARKEQTPDEVVAFSSRPVWWSCPVGVDHKWRASPNQRLSRRTGCPYCSGRRVSVTNSLATLEPKLAAEWHPTRNGKSSPRTIVAGSHRRVWWRCLHGHNWISSVANRTVNGSRCPMCVRSRAPAL
jgi:hypothetical protein